MDKKKTYHVTATIDGAPYATRIGIRDHALIGDEPVDEGGANAGPKAHELLCASLASCTAITIRMYADRKGWPLKSVHVAVDLERIVVGGAVSSTFRMAVHVEGDLDDAQRARVLQIAGMCPVHKTLTHPIAIEARLA